MYNLDPINFLEMVAVKRYAMSSAESAGVHWNAPATINVANFNKVLARKGVVSLMTPGQYLIGGSGQGGLKIPDNTALVLGHGVELILEDNTFQPLIQTLRQFDVGTPVVGTIAYGGSDASITGTISNTTDIHLKHPVGSWIAILGLDLSNQSNRSYQGVYQVSAVATNSITYEMTNVPPSDGNSTVGAIVYPVDNNIRIIGGMWDGNGANNRTGSPYYQGDPHTHVLSFRNVQNLIVSGIQLRRGNSWGIGTNNIRDCTFRDLYGDLYGDGSGTANAILQGSGGARNVLVENVSGTCGDNMVAWSLDHTGTWTYQDHWYGDVYDLRIKNVHTNKSSAAPVMFWGNVNARYHSVTVDGVTGRSQACLVGIDNGFTATSMLNTSGGSFKIKNVCGEANSAVVAIRSDGVWDSLEIDGVHHTRPNTGLPCVSFSKRPGGTVQSFKRVDIRNCSAYIQGPGTTNNRTGPIIDIRDTNIDDLRISGLPLMRINAANVGLVHFDGVEGVVKDAVVSDIRGQAIITGKTCLVRCANTGTGALGKLTLRDSVMTGFDASGGLVHQTATGKVAKVYIDNTPVPALVQAGHLGGVLRDGTGMSIDTVSVTATAAAN